MQPAYNRRTTGGQKVGAGLNPYLDETTAQRYRNRLPAIISKACEGVGVALLSRWYRIGIVVTDAA